MRKLFILFFILSAGIFSAQAQTWQAGVRGGINVASIGGDYAENFKIKPGLVGGLFTEYKTGERAGFFLDILFSQKGANYDSDGGGLNDNRLKLSYIDIPLGLTFYPVEQFGLYAGPQISLLAISKLKTGDKEDDYDRLETNDYGIVGGFRFKATPRLHFDLRYYHGLSDMSELNLALADSDGVTSSEVSEDFNRTASVTLSYALFTRE